MGMKKKAILAGQQGQTIDWSQVQRRLKAAQASLEQGWLPAAEEQQAILRTRARVLAQELAQVSSESEYLEIVAFQLAYETYGIESAFVREVYLLKDYTPLPCTPSFVLGIINVRGHIFSVIDLKKLFELPEKGLSDLNKVIILHSHDMELGILADAILGVRRVAFKDIQPTLPPLTDVREAFLKGVTTERLVILEAEKLLSDKAIIVYEKVET
jgi:purine-binding chemotaxis protein CheW